MSSLQTDKIAVWLSGDAEQIRHSALTLGKTWPRPFTGSPRQRRQVWRGLLQATLAALFHFTPSHHAYNSYGRRIVWLEDEYNVVRSEVIYLLSLALT